jgi:hypothetical protein
MNDRQIQEWDDVVSAASIAVSPLETVRISVSLVRTINEQFIPLDRRRRRFSEARFFLLFYATGIATGIALVALAGVLWAIVRY